MKSAPGSFQHYVGDARLPPSRAGSAYDLANGSWIISS